MNSVQKNRLLFKCDYLREFTVARHRSHLHIEFVRCWFFFFPQKSQEHVKSRGVNIPFLAILCFLFCTYNSIIKIPRLLIEEWDTLWKLSTSHGRAAWWIFRHWGSWVLTSTGIDRIVLSLRCFPLAPLAFHLYLFLATQMNFSHPKPMWQESCNIHLLSLKRFPFEIIAEETYCLLLYKSFSCQGAYG